jgi:hypothetical protein
MCSENYCGCGCGCDPCVPPPLPNIPLDVCKATTRCAIFSLYQSYYQYWKKIYSISRINRMYSNATPSSNVETTVVFSYNFVGLKSGSFWGIALFNKITGLYTFKSSIQPTVEPCELLPQSVIAQLPIGVDYDLVQYVNNCDPRQCTYGSACGC